MTKEKCFRLGTGLMARLPRVVLAEVPHHVTQRGNARRFMLDCDTDRKVYLELLRDDIERRQVALLGYCLMSNHVHLVMVPNSADGLAQALKRTHGRYASYWNALHGSSGHLWQGRFYSCPLDQPRLWEALRYTELNPVRAGLVADAGSWPWSSATVHLGQAMADGFLDIEPWQHCWSASTWHAYLAAGETQSELAAIRHCTYTGRPLGTTEFISELEQKTQRPLAAQKGGRPRLLNKDARQSELAFGA
jgi:putative transposase